MTMFTVPIGNKELPKEYQNISVDIAELMQSMIETDPKRYIKELLLMMEGIEKINTQLTVFDRFIIRQKLLTLLKIIRNG